MAAGRQNPHARRIADPRALLGAAVLCLGLTASARALPAESGHNYNGANHNNERCVALSGARIAVRDIAGRPVEGEQLPRRTIGPLYDTAERCAHGAGIALEGIEAISLAGETLYYAKPTAAERFPGFVARRELAEAPPTPEPANAGEGTNPVSGHRERNGAPAAAAAGEPSYLVTPVQMEHVQCYAAVRVANPIVSSCTPNYEYEPYGQPTAGARYALMTWSWVEVEGGGIARAAVAEGALFHPAAVAAITHASFDNATHASNGSVTARYGYVESGEQRVYGWMVTSHTFAGRCHDDMRYASGTPLPETLCAASADIAGESGGWSLDETLSLQTRRFFAAD